MHVSDESPQLQQSQITSVLVDELEHPQESTNVIDESQQQELTFVEEQQLSTQRPIRPLQERNQRIQPLIGIVLPIQQRKNQQLQQSGQSRQQQLPRQPRYQRKRRQQPIAFDDDISNT